METALLETIAAVCLAAHLWCVNVASAAPLIGVLFGWLSRRLASPTLRSYSRTLGVQGIVMLFAGAALGLAMAGVMWVAQERGLFEILPQFSYKIRWALWELLFYVVCMLGYVALASGRMAEHRGARRLRGVLAVLASTNLLYHFPPLFSVMAQAATEPDRVSLSVGPQEFRGLLMQGHVLALTAHFGLASLAVTAVVAMHRLAHMPTPEAEASAVSRAIRVSAIIALAATASQLLFGLLVLLNLGPLAQNRLLGGDWLGTIALALSVLATFTLLHRLAHATVSTVTRVETRQTLLWLMLIVLMMTFTLRRAEKRTRVPAEPATAASPASEPLKMRGVAL